MSTRRPKSVYDGARVEELEEPLLPRWFVLLAVTSIPIALGVAIWAFIVFGPQPVPVSQRRPPPGPVGQLTTDVGQYNIGTTEAVALDLADCQLFRGIQAGGSPADRERIEQALTALCDQRLPEDVARRVRRFGQMGGEIRFAQFQATGVDSTMDLGLAPPRILLNARFARQDTDPLWIAPLVVHDTTYLELEPGSAQAELEARRFEVDACTKLFSDSRASRACEDAEQVLGLPDPLQALLDAGFS
ncbi:MAG: hypothetical protein ACR2HR_16250 [Euzebya sp.]